MHQTKLPAYATEGAIQRRGKLHMYDSVDPARTALVVIDMQNVFMKPGAPAEVPLARDIVPNINRLAGAMRESGGTVVWVQMTHNRDSLADWSVFYEYVNSSARAGTINEWLTHGSEGHALWPGLEVRENDLIVEKCRYSAFLPNSSNIAELLTERGLDTVIITGTLTNVCSESSARDAMMQNFKTIMISDGNATLSDEEHNATLATFFKVFGDVVNTDEMIALLRSEQDRAAVAAE